MDHWVSKFFSLDKVPYSLASDIILNAGISNDTNAQKELKAAYLFLRAASYFDQGSKIQLPDAMSLIDEAIREYPDYSHLYCLQGELYMRKNDYQCAIECFLKAIDRSSIWSRPYQNLGEVYRLLSNDSLSKKWGDSATSIEWGTISGDKRRGSSPLPDDNYLIDSTNNVALIVGTDLYSPTSGWEGLNNPVSDAFLVGEDLKKFGYNVSVLPNPSKDSIRSYLDHYIDIFSGKKDTSSNLIIFIAGHGAYDNKYDGLIVPTDAKNFTKDQYRDTYLTHNYLKERMDKIKAHHKLLILDVCYGGAFAQTHYKGTDQYDDNEPIEVIKEKLPAPSWCYITSGGPKYQVPDGDPGGHSPFVAKLHKCLEQHHKDGKIITFSTLKSEMEFVKPSPRFGNFYYDIDANSDFILIPKSFYLRGTEKHPTSAATE